MTSPDDEEWGPWIEHDGRGCPCVGQWVLAQGLTQPTVFTEKSAMSPTVKNGRTLRERPVNPSSAEVA